jgi:hypothetical protein
MRRLMQIAIPQLQSAVAIVTVLALAALCAAVASAAPATRENIAPRVRRMRGTTP